MSLVKIRTGILLLSLLVLIFGIGVQSPRGLSTPDVCAGAIDSNSLLLARGREIFNLAHCDGCHSARDFSRFDGPVIPGGRGAGLVFPRRLVPVGLIAGPNITPDPDTGLGSWTDAEKIRAIREGIDPRGRKLLPIMPYEHFRKMSDKDANSLAAYLDSLPPVKHRVPASQLPPPMAGKLALLRQKESVQAVSEPSEALKYGEYLAEIGGCMGCHGQDLSGGREFHEAPDVVILSANISPDKDTGIGSWTAGQFVGRFYSYRDYVSKKSPGVPPKMQTPMPWLSLCQLDRTDLQAIYAFLRSRPPVHKAVGTH